MPTLIRLNNNDSTTMNMDMSLVEMAVKRYPGVEIDKALREDYDIQRITLKSVDQDPAPGTLLSPGAKVIVYFEDTDSMMVDVFEGGHTGLEGKTAKEIVEMANDDDAVAKIISAEKERKDLTPEEEVIMKNFFSEKLELEIDESDPTKNMDSAYKIMMASHEIMA